MTYPRRTASSIRVSSCPPIARLLRRAFFWSYIMDVVELIKRHEGYSQAVYRCTANRQTIGFGRNLDDVGISREEAEWLLKRDIERAIGSLRTEPYWLDLSDVRQAVLIDMVFNLGWAGFAKFARLRMALGRKDWDSAANEMRDSQWFKQVGTRSQRLMVMMRSGLWPRD